MIARMEFCMEGEGGVGSKMERGWGGSSGSPPGRRDVRRGFAGGGEGGLDWGMGDFVEGGWKRGWGRGEGYVHSAIL